MAILSIKDNNWLSEQQIANAKTGICGIDVLQPGESATGSWLKITGVSLHFTAN